MRAPDDAAETNVEAARLVGVRAGIAWADGLYRLQMLALWYQRGTLAGAASPLPPASLEVPRIAAGVALHALVAAEHGHFDTARVVLDDLMHDGVIHLPEDNFWLGAVSILAGVAAACGTRAQRSVLRTAIGPRADRLCPFGTGGAMFGTGHHWLARLAVADGDVETARRHLARAADLSHDAGARFWADRARREHAVLARR
jgi:hypothetical protein